MTAPKTIAVAVSGGSDSLALLAWAHQHFQQTKTKLHVVSLDHQLRPESRAETETVVALAARLGHSAERQSWKSPKPSQNAARAWRQVILAESAKRVGAETILLGHTFDDVAETYLMRRRRDKTAPRLAGPVFQAPSPVWPQGRGLSLLRPLLWQRRADLRAQLMRLGWRWIDDPSNKSSAYERSRIRTFLDAHPKLARTVLDNTKLALLSRHSFDADVGRLLSSSSVSVDPDGLIRANAIDLAIDFHSAAIAILVRIASGGDRQLSDPTLRNALEPLSCAGRRITIGGAWLQKTRSGFLIGRDPGAAAHIGVSSLWDGRFEPDARRRLPDVSHPLVRESSPPSPSWRPVIAERIAWEAQLMTDLSQEKLDAYKQPIVLDLISKTHGTSDLPMS